MQQIWISKAGPPEVLAYRENVDPTPRNGEVRIRVEAVGISQADVLGRNGRYREAPAIPYVPGYEVAGVVDSVTQGVTGIKEGDQVFALTRFGGYSDVVCVPYKQVFPRLDWMTAVDAVALPYNYLLAYLMLYVMGSLRPGNVVLIHDVDSQIGLAALDICQIIGAQVYATAPIEKHERLQSKNILQLIDPGKEKYEEILLEQTNGQGMQLILDSLGGNHWHKNYRLLMPTGRLIYCGVDARYQQSRFYWLRRWQLWAKQPILTPFRLMHDNKAVMGLGLTHLWTQNDLFRRWMQQIISWYDEALFRPDIDRTFKFDKAVEAHRYVEDQTGLGKVVLINEQ